MASCTKDGPGIDCIPDELQDNIIAFFPFTNGSLQDFVNPSQTLTNENAVMAADRHNNANCAYQFDMCHKKMIEAKNKLFSY
jgi:hypothetical protein